MSNEFNRNKQIKIEGKTIESDEEKEKKTLVDIDVKDIDKFVFSEPDQKADYVY